MKIDKNAGLFQRLQKPNGIGDVEYRESINGIAPQRIVLQYFSKLFQSIEGEFSDGMKSILWDYVTNYNDGKLESGDYNPYRAMIHILAFHPNYQYLQFDRGLDCIAAIEELNNWERLKSNSQTKYHEYIDKHRISMLNFFFLYTFMYYDSIDNTNYQQSHVKYASIGMIYKYIQITYPNMAERYFAEVCTNISSISKSLQSYVNTHSQELSIPKLEVVSEDKDYLKEMLKLMRRAAKTGYGMSSSDIMRKVMLSIFGSDDTMIAKPTELLKEENWEPSPEALKKAEIMITAGRQFCLRISKSIEQPLH